MLYCLAIVIVIVLLFNILNTAVTIRNDKKNEYQKRITSIQKVIALDNIGIPRNATIADMDIPPILFYLIGHLL